MDMTFIGGSMGSAVGEKVTQIDRARDERAQRGRDFFCVGRRAHAGRHALADADGEDLRGARGTRCGQKGVLLRDWQEGLREQFRLGWVPFVLFDTAGGRDELRQLVDPVLHDLVDQIEPVELPAAWGLTAPVAKHAGSGARNTIMYLRVRAGDGTVAGTVTCETGGGNVAAHGGRGDCRPRSPRPHGAWWNGRDVDRQLC